MKLSKTAASIVVTGVSLAGLTLMPMTASADGTGQIGGGTGVYTVKNLTEGTAYTNTASAKACEELEYSIRLHNPGFVAVNNLKVSVNLPSNASTSNVSKMTATYTDGVVPSTTATASVALNSAQTISYENGTAELFDGNGTLVKGLNDGITSSGVSLGSLNGSTTEFVNFKAKVSCPTPTPPVTPPQTPPATPAAPTALVNTGAGSVIGLFAAVTAAAAVSYRFLAARRLSRQ